MNFKIKACSGELITIHLDGYQLSTRLESKDFSPDILPNDDSIIPPITDPHPY